MSTPPGKFGRDDARNVWWDLISVVAAAGVTIVLEQVLPILEGNDWITGSTVAILSGLLIAIRRWLTDTRPPPENNTYSRPPLGAILAVLLVPGVASAAPMKWELLPPEPQGLRHFVITESEPVEKTTECKCGPDCKCDPCECGPATVPKDILPQWDLATPQPQTVVCEGGVCQTIPNPTAAPVVMRSVVVSRTVCHNCGRVHASRNMMSHNSHSMHSSHTTMHSSSSHGRFRIFNGRWTPFRNMAARMRHRTAMRRAHGLFWR